MWWPNGSFRESMNAEIWINGENRVKSHPKQSISKAICPINELKMPSIYWPVSCLLLHSKLNPVNSNTHQGQKLNMSCYFICSPNIQIWGFPGDSAVKKPSAMQEMQEIGWVPGLERSPGGGHGNLLNILAWKIPWTEEPGKPQSMELQRVGHGLRDWTWHGVQICSWLGPVCIAHTRKLCPPLPNTDKIKIPSYSWFSVLGMESSASPGWHHLNK